MVGPPQRMLSTSLRELLEKGALDHQLQTLHANGIGVQRKRTDIIMPEIENTFWMKGILSCHSPASLLNGKNFHLRSYQEHATLRFSQIRRFTNPDRYVYYEYGSKNQPGGISDPTAGKLFPFQPCTNTSRCHVAILDFYFSKVPPLAIKSDSHFYMKPMPFTLSGINPWFCDENFSKTKLSTLLKTMMKEANISGNFTNHSLRVTGDNYVI